MEQIYVDSSVYFKLFQRERGSITAKRLFSLAKPANNNIKLFLSYWTINESISVIDKSYNQRNKISERRRDIIIATMFMQIEDYHDSDVAVVRLNHDLIKDSMEHIYTYHISADDALHLHIAYKTNCKWLVTNDKQLKRQADNKMGLSGLRIIDIENKQEMNELLSRVTI